jgi:aspartate kinase
MPTLMKFGGTSVADAHAFENVARIVASQSNAAPVIVVSAMSGVTDALLAAIVAAGEARADEAITSLEETFRRHHESAQTLLTPEAAHTFGQRVDSAANQINELLRASAGNPLRRRPTQDAVLAFGEMLSSDLLAELLNHRGVNAQHVDARRCIITDDQYTCAQPLMPDTLLKARNVLTPVIENGLVPVLGGFIASTQEGTTTTLGRGGSDYTAALIGAALTVDEIQIWTDVTGVLTADPRVVPEAQTVERLSYAEASELAYFGAKVLHPKTIQPAIEGRIPVRICNSHAPEEIGTFVGPETETSDRTIKAIAHKGGVTTVQVTSARMLGAYGFLRALFEVFERHRTVVDVVATSEVSVSLSLDDASALPVIVQELEQLGTVRVEKGCAILCVVGEGLRGTPGIAARVFSAISDINVTLISQGASSINFTFAIEDERMHEAVKRLHAEFFGPQKGTKDTKR